MTTQPRITDAELLAIGLPQLRLRLTRLHATKLGAGYGPSSTGGTIQAPEPLPWKTIAYCTAGGAAIWYALFIGGVAGVAWLVDAMGVWL